MTRSALSLTLILGLVATMAYAATPDPLWLHENWQLETSAKIQADGKALVATDRSRTFASNDALSKTA